MKFVVDTNVVVSGALRPASKPGRILDLMLAREFSYAGSTELVEEYREVLKRPKFGFDAASVDTLIDGLAAGAELGVPYPQRDVISNNPKDQFVIDLACAANAYITTGNAKHFVGYERTVSPAEALDLLRG